MGKSSYLAVWLLITASCCYANTNNDVQQENQAIVLARSGSYKEALNILDNLKTIQDRYWDDYLTILCWDKQYAEAESVFIKKFAGDLHKLQTYALMALADVYFNEKNTDRLCEIAEVLITRKEYKSVLKITEKLAVQGEIISSSRLYSRLLDLEIAKDSIFFSQALVALERLDLIETQYYYDKAMKTVNNNDKQKILDMDALIAAKYIQKGENERAIEILRKHINTGLATNKMKADYLVALRYLGKNREAEKSFKEWFHSIEDIPIYGIQNVADMYFREKKYDKAAKLYKVLLNKEELPYSRISYAYCLGMNGKDKMALEEYKFVADKYPGLHKILASDGKSLLASGKRYLGRNVFSMLGITEEERLNYQYQYAESLAENGFYHESEFVYDKLRHKSGFGAKSLYGSLKNDVRKGLNSYANNTFDILKKNYAAEQETFASATYLEQEKVSGDMFTYFSHTSDYKGNNNFEYGIVAENHLDKNVYLHGEMNLESYKKDNAKALVRHLRLGPEYRFKRGLVGVNFVHSYGGYDSDSAEANLVYEFSDYSNIRMSIGKRPHAEAEAVINNIDERYFLMRLEQRVNEKTLIGVETEVMDISDGNRFRGISGDIIHNILNEQYHINNLLLNYGYGTYDVEKPFYESPQLRVNYGAGISQKLISKDGTRSLEFVNMLSWGHDNNEPTDFNPYTRIEYVKNFNARQKLTIGGEYGWRSDKLQNINSLSQSHYNYYLNYYWEW